MDTHTSASISLLFLNLHSTVMLSSRHFMPVNHGGSALSLHGYGLRLESCWRCRPNQIPEDQVTSVD